LKKIALFGGTFNPVHKGHISLAVEVQDLFKFDKFYFVPAKIPPHKKIPQVSPENRIAMLKLAMEFLDKRVFEISDVEIRSRGKSYTYITLKEFNKTYKNNELFFIVGTDIFATIQSWNRWEDLFDLANFIVVNRPNYPFSTMLEKISSKLLPLIIRFEDFKFGMEKKIILTTIKEVPISSTDIRELIAMNRHIEFLPEKVSDYINKYNLYREV